MECKEADYFHSLRCELLPFYRVVLRALETCGDLGCHLAAVSLEAFDGGKVDFYPF